MISTKTHPFTINQIDHIALQVQNAASLAAWYKQYLGFEITTYPATWGHEPIIVTPPGQKSGLALFSKPSTAADEHLQHNDYLANTSGKLAHFAFNLSVPDFYAAQNWFKIKKLPFTYQDHQHLQSIYLTDPDQNCVELTASIPFNGPFVTNTHLLPGLHGKPILADICYLPTQQPKPIIIFAHGFKGFKDWGHFSLLSQYFAALGFVFVKFNFSHNGTTPEQPTEFADLEAFGHNNFGIELDDLGEVINAVALSKILPVNEAQTHNIMLIGHSRGGGTVLLKAHEDPRVKAVATWASVAKYGEFWDEETMEKWRQDGVMYIYNARTKQNMPMYWSLYEAFYANPTRYDIPMAAANLQIPALIIHGQADTTVEVSAAYRLQQQNKLFELFILPNGDHTFEGKHPWESIILPHQMAQVVNQTAAFFYKTLSF
ncbi:MAG: dienelactone hydrolase family protein [Sphingobacteriales bacterium]|jgi:pimeloyl-ACP methyl ester carboxylesterase|nr:dienelactone hydrolase family protein [Sphingobacteriales bacterium]MBP9140591.1 dienelactone hydrolase family protein [Chitinophagales bacterium]MDA0197381.1 dienelactone hydrolase family protein [Bacteroidota bacterium]MBK6888669.1 dienelactone hydrolase family protein [Sphingobacteriales bacterium]MBK7528822.1 dienelactone hydrolase family protein [Sphingobacteriales bacterium]